MPAALKAADSALARAAEKLSFAVAPPMSSVNTVICIASARRRFSSRSSGASGACCITSLRSTELSDSNSSDEAILKVTRSASRVSVTGACVDGCANSCNAFSARSSSRNSAGLTVLLATSGHIKHNPSAAASQLQYRRLISGIIAPL